MMCLKRKYSSVPKLISYIQFSKIHLFAMYVFPEHFILFSHFPLQSAQQQHEKFFCQKQIDISGR